MVVAASCCGHVLNQQELDKQSWLKEIMIIHTQDWYCFCRSENDFEVAAMLSEINGTKCI